MRRDEAAGFRFAAGNNRFAGGGFHFAAASFRHALRLLPILPEFRATGR
jgi:hypothetical protein